MCHESWRKHMRHIYDIWWIHILSYCITQWNHPFDTYMSRWQQKSSSNSTCHWLCAFLLTVSALLLPVYAIHFPSSAICSATVKLLAESWYTLGKKGCYTPIEDNKTKVDRTFVFPLGWNWHDMDPWLFPNEIRHYLGQTSNARSSGIVELRNLSIGGRSPKSIFTLWQLWINICIFFSKVFLIVRTMPRPTPMGIRHEVFALAREGIKQGAIAARVGLTRVTVNRILKRHAATGSLVPGKSSGAPRKTTPRQDRALLRMVRQDRFLSARALTARMRNLYGMRAGRTTVNNQLLSRGYRAYRPTTKPLLTANHRRLRLE